jgi:hypothetical protein
VSSNSHTDHLLGVTLGLVACALLLVGCADERRESGSQAANRMCSKHDGVRSFKEWWADYYVSGVCQDGTAFEGKMRHV